MAYYNERDTYTERDDYRSGGGGGSYNERDSYTETDTYTDRNRYGGGGYSETDTYTETSNYGGGQGYNQPPAPPRVPRPWIAEWDTREARYIFINNETGERRWEPPYSADESYTETRTYYNDDERRPEHKSHGLMYGAMGAAAGLAGGAFLMHEGSEIKQDYEQDRYRVDEFGNRMENDVEYAPERLAGWAGRKGQEVEDIPQDIEGDFDRFGNRVERRFDDGVDDVERFDDNVGNAYEDGREERRYEDRW